MKVADHRPINTVDKVLNVDSLLKVLCFAAVLLFLGGVINELVYLFCHEVIYLNIPLKADLGNNDQNLYFAMGRSWLNGLTFYKDLFETKPPIIFMIAALSLLITGGNAFLLWLQFALLILFVLILTFFAYTQVSRLEQSTQVLVVSVAALLGLLFIVETLDRKQGYGPEGFALLFSTIPALSVASHRKALDIVGGISLGIAAMLKEPFVAGAVLAMLVVCRSRNDVSRIVKICVIACLTSLVILFLSGSLSAYFSIYLPEMFGARSASALIYPDYSIGVKYIIPIPLWMRGLNVYRLFLDLGSSTRLFLGLFLFASTVVYVLLRTEAFHFRSGITTVGVLLVAFFSGHQFYIFLQLFNGLHQLGEPFPWFASIPLKLLALSVLPPLLTLGAIAVLRTWKTALVSLLVLLGLMACSALAAFNGDFIPNYFVFAFPALIVLCLFCLLQTAREGRYVILAALALLLVLHTVMPFQYDHTKMDNSLGSLYLSPEVAAAHERTARALDALLTACHTNRYLIAQTDVDLKYIYALTKHSPYQITYGQQRSIGAYAAGFSDIPNAYLAAQLKHDLGTTQIIIASDSGAIPPIIGRAITDQFADNASCARPQGQRIKNCTNYHVVHFSGQAGRRRMDFGAAGVAA